MSPRVWNRIAWAGALVWVIGAVMEVRARKHVDGVVLEVDFEQTRNGDGSEHHDRSAEEVEA